MRDVKYNKNGDYPEILSEKKITNKELHDLYLFHDENGNEIPRIEFQREMNSQPDKYKSP